MPLTNLTTLASTTHEYSHGNGPLTLDENRGTKMDNGTTAVATHMFNKPYDITAVTLYTQNYANLNEEGTDARGHMYSQYTLNGSDWVTFPTAEGILWEYTPPRGGRGDFHETLDQTEYAIEVSDVVGVRMDCYAYGQNGWYNYIWEFHVFGNIGGGYCGII